MNDARLHDPAGDPAAPPLTPSSSAGVQSRYFRLSADTSIELVWSGFHDGHALRYGLFRHKDGHPADGGYRECTLRGDGDVWVLNDWEPHLHERKAHFSVEAGRGPSESEDHKARVFCATIPLGHDCFFSGPLGRVELRSAPSSIEDHLPGNATAERNP